MQIKKLLFITAAVAMVITKAKAQNIPFKINGKIASLSAPAKAYLMYTDLAGRKIDSANINSGVFAFTGSVDQPKAAVLYISKTGTGLASSNPGYLLFYLEKGDISISIPDTIQHAKVLGGPINAGNEKLKTDLLAATEKMSQLNGIYAAASPEKRTSKSFTDSLSEQSNIVINEQKAIYLAFIKANTASMMSLFALTNYGGPFPDVSDVERIFNLLSANVRESEAGLKYAAGISRMKKIALGATAPDFTLADTLGKAVSLHNFKGKYVLIDFWASWCGPCRADNPSIIKTYNTFKNKNFTILGVSLDQAGQKTAWLKAIHDDHLPWVQVSDLNGWESLAARLYEIKAIPQNFLLNPDGKIIGKNIKGDDLAEKLKSILDK